MIHKTPPSASPSPRAEHVSDSMPTTNGFVYSTVAEYTDQEQKEELSKAIQELIDIFELLDDEE